jgi:putative oxidoreductase
VWFAGPPEVAGSCQPAPQRQPSKIKYPSKEAWKNQAFQGIESRYRLLILKTGCILQRLFSTFPDGWPGRGLLLLRLCASVFLIHYAIAGLFASPNLGPATVIPDLITAVAGISLLAGWWTPIAGTVVAVTELWIAFSQTGDPWAHIGLAALGAGLAMIGPGAWSVDARLFGRKRLDIGHRAKGRHSTPP